MKIFLYNCLILILLPAMVVRIVFKSFKDKDYRLNFSQRFGIYNNIRTLENPIWFHAVSLGEVISSKKIISKICKNNEVILTVSTPTGLREAKKIYGDKLVVIYSPWDFLIFINNFYKKFNPIALVIFETEIWPSMIYFSSKKNIPIVLSNARLSESSFQRYRRLKFFILDTFNKFSLILAQSNEHVHRFESMGVAKNKIKQVGSVKFDSDSKDNLIDSSIQRSDNLILAASTHIGEDEMLAETFIKLKENFKNLRLVIVPRHPERSGSVLKICEENGIKSKVSSIFSSEENTSDVVIINSIGILNNLYRNATISFVGGSLLKKYGGHNIVEPAINKCPFIVGPFMKNFEEIINLFETQHACIQLSHSNELYYKIKELLNDQELRNNMANNALKVVESNRGSSDIQFNHINNLLNHEISNCNN